MAGIGKIMAAAINLYHHKRIKLRIGYQQIHPLTIHRGIYPLIAMRNNLA